MLCRYFVTCFFTCTKPRVPRKTRVATDMCRCPCRRGQGAKPPPWLRLFESPKLKKRLKMRLFQNFIAIFALSCNFSMLVFQSCRPDEIHMAKNDVQLSCCSIIYSKQPIDFLKKYNHVKCDTKDKNKQHIKIPK